MSVLLGLLAFVSCLSGQVVEGTVINSVTGAPLAGVAVQIQQRGRAAAYQTTTDVAGTFHIDDVKPGDYTANFSKQFFLPPDSASPASKPFHVNAGSDPV